MGDPQEVAHFLKSLDVALLLTHTTPLVKEQFGRVIIEAQGCGTPVIGAHSGAIPDIIGEGGWIVPEQDPAALGKLIESVYASPQDHQRKASLALENVRDRFTYSAVANQMLSAWKAADARRRASR